MQVSQQVYKTSIGTQIIKHRSLLDLLDARMVSLIRSFEPRHGLIGFAEPRAESRELVRIGGSGLDHSIQLHAPDALHSVALESALQRVQLGGSCSVQR